MAMLFEADTNSEALFAKLFETKDEEFRIYKQIVSFENGLIKKDTRDSFRKWWIFSGKLVCDNYWKIRLVWGGSANIQPLGSDIDSEAGQNLVSSCSPKSEESTEKLLAQTAYRLSTLQDNCTNIHWFLWIIIFL